jgi:hypothetical protein
MAAAVGFAIFVAIALVGVRVAPPRLRTIWPILAGCIAFGLVTI